MGKARVLIVEDNFDNLALVRYLVERVGYDVLEAMNGIEGNPGSPRATSRFNPDGHGFARDGWLGSYEGNKNGSKNQRYTYHRPDCLHPAT